jgi:acyl carrier protein
MSDPESQLLRCFASVFPSVAPEELRDISIESAGVWDSLASVTLTAVVEEECGIAIDPALLPDLTSYKAFLVYIEQQRSR